MLSGQSNGCCTGQPIPTPGDPDGVIAGWWEDLNPSLGGTVSYATLGSSPNRVFIVQFSAIEHYGGGNAVSMQFKLYEGSDVIEVHYQTAPSDGGTHSAGVENQDGTVGVQYYLGTAGLPVRSAVRYTPAVVFVATDSDFAEVNVLYPNIDVDPLSLSSTQPPNVVTSQNLDVANTGTAPLDLGDRRGQHLGGRPEPAAGRFFGAGRPVRRHDEGQDRQLDLLARWHRCGTVGHA